MAVAAHRGHGPAGGGPGRGVGDHRHLRLRPHRGAPVDPDAHAVLTGADRPAAPPGPPTADPDLPGSHTAVADQPGATDVHAPAGSHPGGELPGQRRGKALSIAYIDSGGVLQTDFNVVLPWSMQVSLDASVSDAAMVTVITAGTQVTCSLSVDGEQVRRHSGAFLTICAAAG